MWNWPTNETHAMRRSPSLTLPGKPGTCLGRLISTGGSPFFEEKQRRSERRAMRGNVNHDIKKKKEKNPSPSLSVCQEIDLQ